MDVSSCTPPANDVIAPPPMKGTSCSVNLSSPESFNGCYNSRSPDILSRSFNLTKKLMSPAASSGPFCRICHEGDYKEDLVSLCKCTGSVGMVHISCMERWLSTRRNNSDKCEICNFSFETVRSPKSLLEWYRSDQGDMGNRRGILGDIACFSLITPLAGVSAFLCFEGTKRQVIWNNSLEAGCLMALATFLITIYIAWNILTFRYHYQGYMRWRSINQNVRLVHYTRKSTSPENPENPNNGNSEQNVDSGLPRGKNPPALMAPLPPTDISILSDTSSAVGNTSNSTLTHT